MAVIWMISGSEIDLDFYPLAFYSNGKTSSDFKYICIEIVFDV